jgi:hypothetical protein
MTFDPKVTWAVILALAFQTMTGLLWAGSAAARLAAVEERVAAAESTPERLAALEVRLADVQASLIRIEEHLETVRAR